MIIKESKTKTKTRKKIVKAAKDLFIKNGIAQTSITEICEMSEIERQTFYNYFQNKDEIAEYIYVFNLHAFYSEGFNNDTYQDCKNGYEKVEQYFRVLVERYFDHIDETIFLVHYDYYFQKEPDMKLISSIYKEYNMIDPSEYFAQGVKDQSISFPNDDPYEFFYIFAQSVGAYANRIIYRSFDKSDEIKSKQKDRLAKMIYYQLHHYKNIDIDS